MIHRVKAFLDFKKLNDSLFIFVDKSPKLCYITKTDYDDKLADLFVNNKYKKLENFVIEKELVEFRKILIETLGKSITNVKYLNLKLLNTISGNNRKMNHWCSLVQGNGFQKLRFTFFLVSTHYNEWKNNSLQ